MGSEAIRMSEMPPKPVCEAYKQQMSRKKMDEEMSSKLSLIRQDNRTNELARWHEELEQKRLVKSMQESRRVMASELDVASQASILVRRAALQKQIERDYTMFERELTTLGKTFYKQRM